MLTDVEQSDYSTEPQLFPNISACQASERCRYTLVLNLLALLVQTYIFRLLRASERCSNAAASCFRDIEIL